MKTDPVQTPLWLQATLDAGYKPYIATSASLLPYLNTKPFGIEAQCFLMEEPSHHPFHEAYLLSNSLSFESPDLKMPHWVLIDCALMQTAVVGFTKSQSELPEDLLVHYRRDPSIDLDRLPDMPVSGQVSSPAIGARSLTGISLFSLGRKAGGYKQLGLHTKALGLEVYKARDYDFFYGISQYNNPAIKIHGRFSPRMEIYQPIVPLHPKKDMTFIYKMAVDYDPAKVEDIPEPVEPSFWLAANDIAGKQRMIAGMADGKRYIIAPPFAQTRDGQIYLPIIEERI